MTEDTRTSWAIDAARAYLKDAIGYAKLRSIVNVCKEQYGGDLATLAGDTRYSADEVAIHRALLAIDTTHPSLVARVVAAAKKHESDKLRRQSA